MSEPRTGDRRDASALGLTALEGKNKAAFEIAGQLREQIVRGDLAPGEALPVESALTEQLSASKGVVREALRILELEGLVVVRRGLGGGPRVTHPSIISVAQAIGVHLQLQAVSVTDVWKAHGELVLSAIGQLASAPTASAIDAVSAAIDELETEVGTRWEYSLVLTGVTEELVRQAGNATQLVLIGGLHEIIASELASADAALGFASTETQGDIVQALRSVLEQIGRGRGDEAKALWARQVERTGLGLDRLLPGATVVDVFPWRMP